MISAQISIPLAFDTVASETIQSPVLNIDQLKSLFPTKLDPALVHKTSKTILEKSFGNMNFALTNQALKKNLVVRIHSQKIPSLNPERDLQWGKLAQYQKEAADYVASDNNAKFIYTAEELGKVSPDKIFRIDLTLNIN